MTVNDDDDDGSTAGAGQAPAASGRAPAASGRAPAASGRAPAASGRAPAAKPAAGAGQAPAAKPAAGAGQAPAASGRAPAASGRAPAAKPAAGAGQAPAASGRAPAASDPALVDFKTLRTVEELVEAYNDMVPTAVDLGLKKIGAVRMFVDVKTGVLACERLHDQITKARSVTQKKEKTMATKKVTKSKVRKAVKGKTTAIRATDTQKITVSVKENPCRKDTEQYRRLAHLMKNSGKTVAEFKKTGGLGVTLRRAIDEGWAKLSG